MHTTLFWGPSVKKKDRKLQPRQHDPIDRNLVSELLSDVVVRGGRTGKTPGRRRSTVRAIFAAVEGMTWSLKLFLLEHHRSSLEPHELPFLAERQFVLGEDGRLKEQQINLPFKNNVRFTLQIVNRVIPTVDLDFGADGWQRLLRALQVRHRLTHPKSVADLDVTDDELDDAFHGLSWLLQIQSVELDQLMESLRKAIAQTEATSVSSTRP